MMIAAVYARYSSDKQRATSIEDQVRNCERFADERSWAVDKHYSDQAISGSRADRPGYQQMLTEAKAGAFEVVLVDDLSRLSRDDIELKQFLRRLRYWDIRVIGVSDGFDSDSKGHKLHAGVRGLINEIYLDDLREKTHRGLAGQALKGFNTGGRCYGYSHVPIEDSTRKDEHGRPLIVAVKREIKSDEAKWIRQIYTWYAEGHTPRWIAAELNRRNVPSPRGSTWAASAIYGNMRTGSGLLNNELYVGRYVWNRSRWTREPDSGRRRRIPRPESEWIICELPELRILAERRAAHKTEKTVIERRLSAVEREISNIMDAIKAGVLTPTTKSELEKAEAEKTRLQAVVGTATPLTPARIPDLSERYLQFVGNLEETLKKDTSRARAQIQTLLGSEISLHPQDEGFLEAEIVGDYRGLISLSNEHSAAMVEVGELSVVAGARNQRYLQLNEVWL